MIAGRIRTKTEGIAKQRGIKTDDAGAMKLIREELKEDMKLLQEGSKGLLKFDITNNWKIEDCKET